MFSFTVSSLMRSCGYKGVRLSNRILLRASSGDSKLTASILTSAKYFSPSCRRAHLAADGIAGLQVELTDLSPCLARSTETVTKFTLGQIEGERLRVRGAIMRTEAQGA